jgi:hypothetical protein
MSESDEPKSIVPMEQRQVMFYEDELTAVLVDEEGRGRGVYVPIRPICELLGLAWPGQFLRIRRDPVMSEVAMSVIVTLTDIEEGSRRPRSSEMVCLPLKYLPGWLFGIQANRVKPELRDKIILYQKECHEVLADAFREGRLTGDPTFSELLKTDSPAVQAYKMIMAMAEMARQQIILESRVDDHERRLEAVETLVSDTGKFINKEQAMHLSQAVKTLALEIGKRTGKNEFQGVYGELYRRFRIPSYRELPAYQFNSAMKFLREWYASRIGDEDVPF